MSWVGTTTRTLDTPPRLSTPASYTSASQAPEHRRHFDVHHFMKAHTFEGAAHGMVPIAAAGLWLGTYKH